LPCARWRGRAWAQATRSGDLAEIEGLDERSPVIPLVTSTRDNCLGTECPSTGLPCVQARREAMAADLVVVNHHLFFADLALRDSGVAELLPTVDAAVFDEAHQLVEAGVQFLGTQLGTGAGARLLARDLLAAGLQHARGLQPWPSWPARWSAPRASCAWLRRAAARGARRVKLRWDRARGQSGAARAADAAAWPAARALAERRRWPRRWPSRARLPAAGAERAGAAALGRRFAGDAGGRARALDRPVAAAGAAGRVAAGHPRHAHRAARGRAQGLGLHLGHAGRRRGAELVHRGRAGGRRHAARGQPLRLRRPRAAVGARALSLPNERATRRRWARWRRAAPRRWAAAPSC
jgi:hypothetical protein